jgi:hypothetical protein
MGASIFEDEECFQGRVLRDGSEKHEPAPPGTTPTDPRLLQLLYMDFEIEEAIYPEDHPIHDYVERGLADHLVAEGYLTRLPAASDP